MLALPSNVYEQLEEAYGLIAEAGYRPAAVGDGVGHITGPLNLVKESISYAEHWWEEEDKGRFFIGCSRWENRVALVLVIEAARLLCGSKDRKLALRLLRTAVAKLEQGPRPNRDSFEPTFAAESDLQRVLRANIEQLEPGLKIIDGGKERTLKTGRIDILAEDRDQATVVIELKTSEANEHDVTQILRYTGELEGSEKRVRGVLVAAAFSRRACAAASQVHNLQLRKYSFNFVFKASDEPATLPESEAR
jgi:hypothetical protein